MVQRNLILLEDELQEGQLLKPKYDFIFKLIFGEEGRKEFLINFLNSILNENVVGLTYKPNELKRIHETDYEGILDVRVETEDGRHIDIEVQIAWQKNYIKRSNYYASCMIVDQVKKGQSDYNIDKVVAVNIIDFKLDKFEDLPHAMISHIEVNSNTLISDMTELHFLQLKNLDTLKDGELKDWLEFISLRDENKVRQIAERNPIIKKALKEVEKISMDKDLRDMYKNEEKRVRDYINTMNSQKEKGYNIGLEEGKLQTIINFLDLITDDKAIADAQGLDVEVVKQLREEHQKNKK